MKLASALYAHKATPLTVAQATDIGQHYAFFACNPNQLNNLDGSVRTAGAKIFSYKKTDQSKDGTHPAAWYSHNTKGQRRYDSHWNVYVMEPSNKDWIAFHTQEYVTACMGTNVDGIFSDSASMFSFTQGGNDAAKPPGWTVKYTQAEWLNLLKANLDTWAGAIHPKALILNGLDQYSIHLYTPTVGLIEAAYNSKSNNLPDAVHWATYTQFLFDAQAAGWSPWVWIKLFGSDYSTSANKWRSMIVPTLAIADNGMLFYDISPSEGGSPCWDTQEYLNPIHSVDIGMPVDYVSALSSLLVGQLYWRQYTKGWAVYNPTPSTLTAVVPGSNPRFTFILSGQKGALVQTKQTTSYVVNG